jgi:hypothetical protein
MKQGRHSPLIAGLCLGSRVQEELGRIAPDNDGAGKESQEID